MLRRAHDDIRQTRRTRRAVNAAVRLHRTGNGREVPQTQDVRRGNLQVVVRRVVGNDNRAFAGTEAFFGGRFLVQLVIRVVFAVFFEHVDGDVLIQRGRSVVIGVVAAAVLEQKHREHLLRRQHAEFHLVLAQDGHGDLHFVPRLRHFQSNFRQNVLAVEHHQPRLRIRQGVRRTVKGERDDGALVEALGNLREVLELRQVQHGVAQAVVDGRVVARVQHRARNAVGVRHLNSDVRTLARQRRAQERVHVNQLHVDGNARRGRELLVNQRLDDVRLVTARADPQRQHDILRVALRHVADLVVVDDEGVIQALRFMRKALPPAAVIQLRLRIGSMNIEAVYLKRLCQHLRNPVAARADVGLEG